MVCCAALGFVLIFLLHPALGDEIENLPEIIKKLQSICDSKGQYALGINVPARHCAKVVKLKKNFLSQDNADEVRTAMNSGDQVYSGKQLIGAKPKSIPGTNNSYHSEYLLLIHSMTKRLANEDPLMQTLLNKDKKGCTVFFTVNSPCVNTCSTSNHRYSIIPALEMFSNRNLKAFIFQEVWKHDNGSNEWGENIKTINMKIPVYRCSGNECVKCVNNNEVDQRCLRNN